MADLQANKGTLRRYTIWYVATMMMLLLTAAAINFVVDPLGRLRVIDVVGFNQIKIAVKRDTRIGKTASLQECDFAVIMLGTSRIESGMNPKVRGLPGRAYNAGLKGTSIYEMTRLGHYMLEHQSPELVIIGLDFLAFNERRRGADDFNDSLIGDGQSSWSLFKYLASLEQLVNSWYTIRLNSNGIAIGCFDDGFNTAPGLSVSPAEAFRLSVERFRESDDLYGDFRGGSEYPQRLQALLEKLRAAGIRTELFISPVHAVQLEVLAELELDDDFEQWKRDMVQLVAAANATGAAEPLITLWDFSGYNSITTETVPVDGTALRGYRDPAHYRSGVGNLVLRRMLGTVPSRDPLPDDFGVQLRPENVEEWLAQQRALADRYSLDSFGVSVAR